MRFVHSSDWHIGKSFRFAEDAAQLLRDERLDAINRLGELARVQGAAAVLVGGDIYDVETPAERTLRQPIERMRAFREIEWHLIPGNHDAHTPRGPWERLERLRELEGLPDNIHLHLAPEPTAIAGSAAWLVPGVLRRRHAADDPTAAMDTAPTPEGVVRIGLAHGSVASFGTDASSTSNLIAPDRPERAGLSYLALGDWHGASRIGERCWYSGTPETDDFGVGGDGGGEALVVQLDGPRAPAIVTRHRTGRFAWRRIEATLHNATDIDILETRLRGLSADLATVLVWLRVSGALSLAEREAFESRIQHGVGSALRVLRVDDAGLLTRPTEADLEAIEARSFVRAAADKLSACATNSNDPDQQIAAAALQRLYVLHMRATGSAVR